MGEGVVSIRLTEKNKTVLRDFLSAVETEEKSHQALLLTEKVININSASYTAWAYRWQCLQALGTNEDFKAEQTFLEHIAASNVKNYQLWNHRRQLAFALGLDSALDELEFAGHCLEDDQKNYHTWAHRQAVVDKYKLWDEELVYTAVMIEEDVRNNSAWNQRYNIVSKQFKCAGRALCEKEMAFAIEAIMKAPHNESPWNYVRGLVKLAGGDFYIARCSRLQNLCQDLLGVLSCTPAFACLADIYMGQMRMSQHSGETAAACNIGKLAGNCFESLLTCDPKRRNYWNFQLRVLQGELKKLI